MPVGTHVHVPSRSAGGAIPTVMPTLGGDMAGVPSVGVLPNVAAAAIGASGNVAPSQATSNTAVAPGPGAFAHPAAMMQQNPQMMIFMQQMLLQQQMMLQQQRAAFVPNNGQQKDVVVDENDTIDGDLDSASEPQVEAEVERFIDTSFIPPVTFPCPFLPVTISKIGGKSILFLILYAHIDRYVAGEVIRKMAIYHFPASWEHFCQVMKMKFPTSTMSPPAFEKLFERHLLSPVISVVGRAEWNNSLSSAEGVVLDAVTGVSGSFFRLSRVHDFQRPPEAGPLLLAERLIATLRAMPTAMTTETVPAGVTTAEGDAAAVAMSLLGAEPESSFDASLPALPSLPHANEGSLFLQHSQPHHHDSLEAQDTAMQDVPALPSLPTTEEAMHQ